ncbi:MAG: DegT/DnrJ/EryC1/StrS family aminotransferase [Rhodospirillales bacterium]|jgi:perosamine synthetase
MTKLALFDGSPVRTKPFPAYKPIGEEEVAAAKAVVESGVLSAYLGAWHDDFYGGPQVRAFEADWAKAYQAKHAISVNSCTSGLYASVGAAGVGPGDEVIVSPYTMSASATAAIVFNGVPVFADIDPQTYCLDPKSIQARITERTKAIIVVHIFGQSADMDPIMELADQHDLTVIEDCAQAPCATYKGRPVGTLGHLGVFSLNYHKHIHSGEGGMITTNDDGLADRCQLIRNHGEAVVEAKGTKNLVNMIGFNFRLGEIEAAIGQAQLKKAPDLVSQRQNNVAYLENKLSGLPGLGMPKAQEKSAHAYYVHALDYDPSVTGVVRETIVAALRAELPVSEMREREGTLVSGGYVKPLYLQPMYRELVGYGTVSCPFTCPHYGGTVDYSEGICPEAEAAHNTTLISHELMRPPMTETDLDDVANAFHKVFENLDDLKNAKAVP